MTLPSPNFKVNGNAVGVKAAVGAASTVTCLLDSTEGVKSVQWSIIRTDETTVISQWDTTFSISGSVGQQLQFTALTAGTACIIQCQINAGRILGEISSASRFTAKVYVLTTTGFEVLTDNELVNTALEASPTHGAVDPINDFIRSATAGGDVTAIHDNVPAEISIIANKVTPVGADVLLIEDSADSFNKKYVTFSQLPAIVGGVTAAAIIADHSVVRGDGGAKGIQGSGVTLSDADLMAFPAGGKLGIGTATVPHGAVGGGMLAIDGPATSANNGPHVQITTVTDDYPIVAIYAYSHDDVAIMFDACVHTGSSTSCDAGSNYKIAKKTDELTLEYDSGIAQGSGIAWNTGLSLDTAGLVTIPTQANIGKLGIGTATVPHGGVGAAMLALDGTDSSTAGPHIQITTASTDYPLLQIRPWAHDNVSMLFDAYWDGAWKSSSANGNFGINKSTTLLKLWYDSGITAGSVVTWNTGLTLDTAGQVNITENLAIGSSGWAAAGDIRHANATVGAAFRNFAGTNNCTVWESNVSDRLIIGGATAGTRPDDISIDATTSTTIAVAGGGKLTVASSFVSSALPVALSEQGGDPATAVNVGAIYTKDASGAPHLFYRTESSGTVYQLTPTGGGSVGGTGTDERLARWTTGNDIQDSGVSLSDADVMTFPAAGKIAMGTIPAAGGQIRGPTGFTIFSRNFGNTDDVEIITVNNADNIYIGNAAATSNVIFTSSAGFQFTFGSALMMFANAATSLYFGQPSAAMRLAFTSTVTTPSIDQVESYVADKTCPDLIMSAQAMGAATGTGKGGNLVLRGGDAWGSGTNTRGNVVLGYPPSSYFSMAKGVFISTADAAPTANDGAGAFLWASTGSVVNTGGALGVNAAGATMPSDGDIRLNDTGSIRFWGPSGSVGGITKDASDIIYIGGLYTTRPTYLVTDVSVETQIRYNGTTLCTIAPVTCTFGHATAVTNVLLNSTTKTEIKVGTDPVFRIGAALLTLGSAAASFDLVFDDLCIEPLIYQAANTISGVNADDLIVRAQDNAYVGTDYLSGNLGLMGGVGTNGNKRGNVWFGTAASDYQDMEQGIFISNATTVPTDDPASGGFLYATAGALWWWGSGGSSNAIGPAGPHCGVCGYDEWRVATLNRNQKSWRFECAHCDEVYSGGPKNVLHLVKPEHKHQILRRGMNFEEILVVAGMKQAA